MKRKILFLEIVLFLFLIFPIFGESLRFTLKSNPYKIVNLPDGYQKIEMEGFGLGGSPGNPELPSKMLPAVKRPRLNWKKLSIFSGIRKNLPALGVKYLKGFCLSALRVPGRL